MLKIYKNSNQILAKYSPEIADDTSWIYRRFQNNETVTFRKIFDFEKNHLAPNTVVDGDYQEDVVFVLGELSGTYYKINKDILGLDNELYLSIDIKPTIKSFVAYRDISIFRKIDEISTQAIYIGGDNENAIPAQDFRDLLASFPNSTELTRYSQSRIARILKDYVGLKSDPELKLISYLAKKKVQSKSKVERKELLDFELQKFIYVREQLENMLSDSESYVEADWQNLIIEFLLLLFPKYVAILPNLLVKDFYSNDKKATNRYVDITFVDASGVIDIIEIKQPFPNSVLSALPYRDNYLPKRELAGAVMQAEKYIFHLNKWGVEGENFIQKKRGNELPRNLKVQITNPKALIIIGRDNNFTNEHKLDFEIIRRKYANMMDILTYDDLLRRLDNIIARLNSNYIP